MLAVQALKWGRMIGLEWCVQTVKERRNGLPVTEFMTAMCHDKLINGELKEPQQPQLQPQQQSVVTAQSTGGLQKTLSLEGLEDDEDGEEESREVVWHAPNLGKGQSYFVEFVCYPMFEVFARHLQFCGANTLACCSGTAHLDSYRRVVCFTRDLS